MATWPTTLPQSPLQAGFSESLPNNVIRTSMDLGPPKVRRRDTAGVRPMVFKMKMSTAQVATLETFFEDDLSSGVMPFYYTHPRTGATVSIQFIVPPRIRAADGRWWAVDMNVLILP